MAVDFSVTERFVMGYEVMLGDDAVAMTVTTRVTIK